MIGGGFVNTDAMWSLVWGREAMNGSWPDYAPGPTPHPLTNFLGALLAPLGARAESVLSALGFFALGAFFYMTGLVAYRLFGPIAAAVATALVMTRDVVLFYGSLAYLDVPYAALVLGAAAMVIRRPRRGAVLVILVIAGLLRPEAWILSGAYWLYLMVNDRREWKFLGLVSAAPILWVLSDLIVTGNPLFSFVATESGTVTSGRPTRFAGVLDAPVFLAQTVRPLVAVAALMGLGIALYVRKGTLLCAFLATTFLATVAPVLAGTPINERYLFATAALVCVAASAPLVLLKGPGPSRRAVGGFCALLLVLNAPGQLARLAEKRAEVRFITASRTDAHRALEPSVPCGPIVVPNGRLVPVVAIWREMPVSAVRDGRRGLPDGSYLWGSAQAMVGIVTLEGRPSSIPPAPRGSVVRMSGGWTLRARCGRAPRRGRAAS